MYCTRVIVDCVKVGSFFFFCGGFFFNVGLWFGVVEFLVLIRVLFLGFCS